MLIIFPAEAITPCFQMRRIVWPVDGGLDWVADPGHRM